MGPAHAGDGICGPDSQGVSAPGYLGFPIIFALIRYLRPPRRGGLVIESAAAVEGAWRAAIRLMIPPAASMRLISIPANPVPDEAATAMLQTPDGVLLRYARWAPPPGRKGTVCLFQGRAEFIEKYFEVVRDLRARGFAVATFDWRGQGLSQRQLYDRYRGHVASFSDYAIDLETFMKEVVLPDCPPPLFALAHSMGAAVLIRSAFRGQRWFDRIVLSAPLIRLAHEWAFGLGPAVARGMRLIGLGGSYAPATQAK